MICIPTVWELEKVLFGEKNTIYYLKENDVFENFRDAEPKQQQISSV